MEPTRFKRDGTSARKLIQIYSRRDAEMMPTCLENGSKLNPKTIKKSHKMTKMAPKPCQMKTQTIPKSIDIGLDERVSCFKEGKLEYSRKGKKKCRAKLIQERMQVLDLSLDR